jgi:hypothetical protein
MTATAGAEAKVSETPKDLIIISNDFYKTLNPH